MGCRRMARAPFQVLVYPYYPVPHCEFEYLLLKRSDAAYWQGIAGGGEGSETPLEAAKRETLEETGIPKDSRFLRLITVIPIPATEFRDHHLWGREICIPQYCFGVLPKEKKIVLSSEHTDHKWLIYEEAYRLVKYEGNKIALWELDKRLKKEETR
jgi:dATP pyrophosphohydrolase